MILIMNDINSKNNNNNDNVSSTSSTTSSPSSSSSSLVTLTIENVNRLSERQATKHEKKIIQKHELLVSIINKANMITPIKYLNNNASNENDSKIKSRRFKSPRFNLPCVQKESHIVKKQPEQTTKFQHSSINNTGCLYRSRRFRQPPSLNHLIKI
jgi:hypothetical protein